MEKPGRAQEQAGETAASRRAAGSLEAEILRIVRSASEPLSPGEVRERIAVGQRELSYSTVVTIISRLYDKGLLTRQRSGRGFCYAALDEAAVAASRMSSALGSGLDHDAVLTRFVSGLSGRDVHLLRRLLADAREQVSDAASTTDAAGDSAGRPTEME